ncbi:MAG: ABC transporter ATP-binding protein [Gammaproteobacteria bacterium]
MPLISLRNIEKSYKTKAEETFVLRQISLDVKEGEFISVMGPSGSGKSTLLGILGMLDGDYRGEFHFLGHAVHKQSRKQTSALGRENIGFIFQQYHLLDDLTVYENLEVPLTYRNIKAKERQGTVADILDRFQIVGKKDLFPSQLSGGQQQLVAVARAVVAKPAVILADEPTGALHSTQGQLIMELLKELNDEGKTIIQVTHSETNASFGDRVVNLFDGWISEKGEAA